LVRPAWPASHPPSQPREAKATGCDRLTHIIRERIPWRGACQSPQHPKEVFRSVAPLLICIRGRLNAFDGCEDDQGSVGSEVQLIEALMAYASASHQGGR
jgi:hypothetical protein